MNERDVTLVREMIRRVVDPSARAGERFYGELFRRAPHVKELFKTDPASQARALMSMLGVIVNLLDVQDQVVPLIFELGRRHASYGVRAEDYDAFGEALEHSIGEVLGGEFTPEMRTAWQRTWNFMADIMREASPRYNPAAPASSSAGPSSG